MQRRKFLKIARSSDAPEPAGCFPLRCTAVEALGSEQLGNGGWHGLGSGHQGGIRNQAARGNIALLRQGIALEPQFADRGQLAPVTDLVEA